MAETKRCGRLIHTGLWCTLPRGHEDNCRNAPVEEQPPMSDAEIVVEALSAIRSMCESGNNRGSRTQNQNILLLDAIRGHILNAQYGHERLEATVQRLTEERDDLDGKLVVELGHCDGYRKLLEEARESLAAKDEALARIETMTNPATYGKGQDIPSVPVYEEVWLIATAALARAAIGEEQQ